MMQLEENFEDFDKLKTQVKYERMRDYWVMNARKIK